jgi:TPP-dependent pyruvate/acetoin dehydrogenase alpha subunit
VSEVEFIEALRAFELTLQEHMAEFRCAVHLCLGQEAVPGALHAGLRKTDWLFSTHRSHGHYLAKGGSPKRLMAEILGHQEGINGGFSGSQSFCDASINFHSTAIVGGLISAAVGAALAIKMTGEDALVVCCVGDGATEQGVFWESLNFAALHTLPVIFVCENNGLSVHAPIHARQAAPLLHKVRAFGVQTWQGVAPLRHLLTERKRLPAFVEVECSRDCAHVSAMEDLRE